MSILRHLPHSFQSFLGTTTVVSTPTDISNKAKNIQLMAEAQSEKPEQLPEKNPKLPINNNQPAPSFISLKDFDSRAIELAARTGNIYQNWTGRSYKDLVAKTYRFSGSIKYLGAMTTLGLLLERANETYQKAEQTNFISQREEEIMLETMGFPEDLLKLSRIFKLFGGIVGTSALPGFLLMISMIIQSNAEITPSYSIGEISVLMAVTCWSASLASHCSAYLPEVFAEYLSLSDLPKPPKKTVGKKIVENFSREFEPAMQPVPI